MIAARSVWRRAVCIIHIRRGVASWFSLSPPALRGRHYRSQIGRSVSPALPARNEALCLCLVHTLYVAWRSVVYLAFRLSFLVYTLHIYVLPFLDIGGKPGATAWVVVIKYKCHDAMRPTMSKVVLHIIILVMIRAIVPMRSFNKQILCFAHVGCFRNVK